MDSNILENICKCFFEDDVFFDFVCIWVEFDVWDGEVSLWSLILWGNGNVGCVMVVFRLWVKKGIFLKQVDQENMVVD